METIATRLQHSRQSLAHEAGAFASSARRAGATFITDTSQAAGQLGQVTRQEMRAWSGYLATEAGALTTPEPPRIQLGDVEQSVLSKVMRVLDLLRDRIARRLARLGDDDVLPVPEYGTLSARAIVTRLDSLSASECATVLAFEQANKKRTTVLRALEHRLAA